MNNLWRYSWHAPRLGIIDARAIILFFGWIIYPTRWSFLVVCIVCIVLAWAEQMHKMQSAALFRAFVTALRNAMMGNVIRREKVTRSRMPIDYESIAGDQILAESFNDKKSEAFEASVKRFRDRL